MVIITDANGNIVKSIPENVYQGSNNANTIVLLAPFVENSQVQIAFRLPNGILTEPHLMTPYEDMPAEYSQYNGWTYGIDATLTELYGTVDLQFRVVTTGQTIASFGCSFVVQKGVAPILPAEPTADIYEQILEALADLGADIINLDARIGKNEDLITTEKGTIVGAINEIKSEAGQLGNDKMDKVNPTGSGALSINRASGYAVGDYSVAVGNNNQAQGTSAMAEGNNTIAYGNYSHAEGHTTIAIGERSHAEGYGTTANGYASHSEGSLTKALGSHSHAQGYETRANGDYQSVIGRFNQVDNNSTYAEIVGVGTSNSNRQNGRTLDWQGNEYLLGFLEAERVKTHSGTNIQVLMADGSTINITNYYTKDEVDAEINSKIHIEFVYVETLPTASASTLNKIYLVPTASEYPSNVKDEYITLRSGTEGNYTYSWEKIGTTAIDLSNYQLKMQFTTMPTASADNEGKVVQFAGTTGVYTKGYFYESKQVLENYQIEITDSESALYGNTYYCAELPGLNEQVQLYTDDTLETEATGYTLYHYTTGYSVIENGDTSAWTDNPTSQTANYGYIWQQKDVQPSSLVEIDNTSITLNASDELQAVGVVNSGSNTVMKQWNGTQQEYDALESYDPNTYYYITDGTSLKGVWTGTQAQYDAITTKDPNIFYYITDAPATSSYLKVFTNVSVSTWTADNTYTGYGYRASISLNGVTADMIPQVIFGATEAVSGNYLPVAESYAGGIYIYSKVNTSITIPTIMVQKES